MNWTSPEYSVFGSFRRKLRLTDPPRLRPPIPSWLPTIVQPLDRIVERAQHYSKGGEDLGVFKFGTCVVLPEGLSDADAERSARETLERVYCAHPDMHPVSMEDGNTVVTYNQPAFNIVLDDVALAHWDEIERMHERALTAGEVLFTPLGQNKFDAFGKKALFGRCFMFMDAQAPEVARIVRGSALAHF